MHALLVLLLLLAKLVKLEWLLVILRRNNRQERGSLMALRTGVSRLGCWGLSLRLRLLLQWAVLQLVQKLRELLLVDQHSLGAEGR